MIDALGFRGIWGKAEDPDLAVLGTLSRVREELASESQWLSAALRSGWQDKMKGFEPHVETHFLSDTIVVAASIHDHELAKNARAANSLLRLAASQAVARIMRTAALGPKPLAYRGAIAVGSFSIDYPFIVGPAIDEAASLMELANGAFVWLAPSATTEDAIYEHDKDDQPLLEMPWSVPLKGGDTYQTRCVNPAVGCLVPEEWPQVRSAILTSMSKPRLELALKYQNTWAFIEKIESREKQRRERAARGSEG
jgi:hypothetical protein